MTDTEGIAEERLALLAQAIGSSPHNLVSKRAKAELATRHVPECVRFASLLPTQGPLLDIGSGGGLPGLVIAIVRPDLEVHLLEATGKKVAFLRETASALGVDVTVHQGRAEELTTTPLAGRFPIVTARAVAPLERLVGWSAPYLAPAGALYAVKGERWAEEVASAASRLADLRLTVQADPATDPQLAPDPADPLRPRVVIIARRS
jgi:16S rRNA (guanine527-N7)-methyltransferase